MTNDEKRTAIYSLLLTVGFLPSIAGFEYFLEADFLYKTCHSSLNELYEILGEKHGKSPKAVARDMITALKNAYNRGWLVRFNDIIGFELIDPKVRVKIKAFMAILSDFVANENFMNSLLGKRLALIKEREAYDITDD